jgi:DnaA-homolog protein
MKQLALDIAAPPAPTLDNFVPGRNAELVVALYAATNGASHENHIYLWGAPGSGRRHLLRATLDAARQHGRHTAWFDAGTVAFDAGDDAFIAVDNVHWLGADAQISLFNLHNRTRAGGGTLIASGDAAPAQLALRADLATRLASGLVYQVHGLNDDEKAAALRRHAEARGFRLAGEVADYLLRHTQRDLPSLLALLDALDRHSLATKRAITLSLLRELLGTTPSRAAAGQRE